MSTYTAMVQSFYRPRAVTVLSRVNGLGRARSSILTQRRFATATVDDSALPLNGYRVLDMTRVLAGVSWRPSRCHNITNKGGVAVLYANTWRSWVRLIQNHHSCNERPAYLFSRDFWFSLLLFELCSQIFSAEVIKVEHPTRGDDTRQWGPPYAKYLPESGKEGPGESAYYLSVSI